MLRNDQTDVVLDDSGKAVMDHIYDQDDPRAYYRSLRMLRYHIPDAAQPVLRHLINARRRATGCRKIKLLDLGCSYGVTGRLLRSDGNMEKLFRHYVGLASCSRGELVEIDQLSNDAHRDNDVSIVGLDVARNACTYAIDSHAIDEAIIANFEEDEPTPDQAKILSGADILVSTGCIGYIGVATMQRILDATHATRPWMVHFVMRMFDYSPIRDVLTKRGYVTRRGLVPVCQRRFVSPSEQEEIVNRLLSMGRDPTGLEDDGAVYADLYISRPAETRSVISADEWADILQTV